MHRRFFVVGMRGGASNPLASLLDVSNVWILNEASGNRLDSVGGKTMTVVNTPLSVLGVDGNGIRFHWGFDDTNWGYLKSTDAAFDIGAAFTFALIASHDATDSWKLIAKGTNTAPNLQYRLFYDNSDAKYTFRVYDGGGPTYDEVKTALSNNGKLDFLVCRYQAGHISIDINSVRTEKDTVITPTTGSGPFNFGTSNDDRYGNAYSLMQYVHRWTRYLTDAETDLLWNSGKLNLWPFTDTTLTDTLMVFDGDSLTLSNLYPHQLMGLMGRIRPYYNKGVSGQRADQMLADATTEIDPLYNSTYTNNIVCAWIGYNDLKANYSAADIHTSISNYCSGRQTAGFKVIIATVTPSTNATNPGDFEVRRLALNTLIRNNYTGYADGIADIGADATLADANNTEYYQGDKLHLTVSGYAVVAGLFKTAIDVLP